MHPISDKELDKLFQRGFEGTEIEPSEGLWSKIAEKMEPAKAKKSFPVFWMAAASVVVVLSAGLYFNRNTEVIKLQGTNQHLANNAGIAPQPDETENKTQVLDEPIVSASVPKSEVPETPKYISSTYQAADPEPQATALVEPEENIVIVNTNPVKLLVSNPMKGVNVPERYYGDQSLLDVTQTDMTINAAESQTTEEMSSGQVAPSRKIRSIGTLVNYVVAKVDKRESKIIEFKDSEEGSEISGVNLGLLKLKSKK